MLPLSPRRKPASGRSVGKRIDHPTRRTRCRRRLRACFRLRLLHQPNRTVWSAEVGRLLAATLQSHNGWTRALASIVRSQSHLIRSAGDRAISGSSRVLAPRATHARTTTTASPAALLHSRHSPLLPASASLRLLPASASLRHRRRIWTPSPLGRQASRPLLILAFRRGRSPRLLKRGSRRPRSPPLRPRLRRGHSLL